MASIASVTSIAKARELLQTHAPGLRIANVEGEYRVWNSTIPKARQEPCAYYTNDLTDAVGTGIVMYQKGAW